MALGLVASRLPALGTITAQGLFYVIAGVTIVSAALRPCPFAILCIAPSGLP